jgi:hypothetical protein
MALDGIDGGGTPVTPSSGPVSQIPQQATASEASSYGGNRVYYRGLPLMLRGSRYATVHTKTNRAIAAMPRQKFMFYASFKAGPSLLARNFESWQTGFAFQIAKIDRPKFNMKTETLKQYNRKRVVYTGIEYPDITITLHDTVDDRVLKVWRDYYNWYFGDGRRERPRRSGDASWHSSVIERQFSIGKGWGFSPPPQLENRFFDELSIYTFYGRKFTRVRMHNPKIVNIEFDTSETDSSQFHQISMTIRHEGVEYVDVASKLGPQEISLFNLNAGDYYEPSDLFGGVNSFLLELDDSINGAIDGLLNQVAYNVPFVGQVLASYGAQAVRASGVTGIPVAVAQRLGASSLNRWGRFF